MPAMNKRLLLALGALAFCTGLPSCGRDSGKMRVAFVSNNSDPFWTIAERGTEKAAAEFNVSVEFRKSLPNNAGDQQRILEDLITTGIKGVAISPNDAANLQGFLK